MSKKKCETCGKARVVYDGTGGWSFIGCYHNPYNGKWVVEIKDCPKEKTIK